MQGTPGEWGEITFVLHEVFTEANVGEEFVEFNGEGFLEITPYEL
jgi:hypothetical protein